MKRAGHFSCLMATVLLATALLADGAHADDSGRISRIFDSMRRNIVPVHYTLRLAQTDDGVIRNKLEGVVCGVILDSSGLVITTADVFPDMNGDPRQTYVPVAFYIRAADGNRYPAKAIGLDRALNLALLQVGGALPAPTLRFGKNPPRPGERVLLLGLLGEKYKYAPTFTEGRIVQALEGPHRAYAIDTLIQDLTIGGLAVSLRGEPLGIIGEDILARPPTGPADLASEGNVLSLFSSSSQGQRPGYPVVFPYKEVIEPLMQHPVPPDQIRWTNRGWLGIIMQPLSKDLADYWHVSGPGGIVIGAVLSGSPAERAGLEVGDVILEVDHAPVAVREQRDLGRFRDMVQAVGVGRELPLRVFRKGRRQTISLTLGNRPKTIYLAEERKDEDFGLTVKEITFDFIQATNLEPGTRGVFISEVENAGWADVGGLAVGDVITSINGANVEDLGQFDAATGQVREQARQEVVFFIRRGTRTLFVPVKTDW
ncbi:MAG: PDZ domain-containing protein [Acidobacteriota bacterium]